MKNNTTGILYLVSTPIGNYDDITFRALKILQRVDIVVCEERKEGLKMLAHYKIEKSVECLNEHNESLVANALVTELRNGKNIALISDCGTPVFSDPGFILVRKAIASHITIVPVPGASSLLPAIIASGFDIKQFLFYGFLSPKRNRRIEELKKLRAEKNTFILMDAPYRLLQVLRDIADIFGATRKLSIAFNLTMDDEKIVRGYANELRNHFERENAKGEFVIVVEQLPQ